MPSLRLIAYNPPLPSASGPRESPLCIGKYGIQYILRAAEIEFLPFLSPSRSIGCNECSTLNTNPKTHLFLASRIRKVCNTKNAKLHFQTFERRHGDPLLRTTVLERIMLQESEPLIASTPCHDLLHARSNDTIKSRNMVPLVNLDGCSIAFRTKARLGLYLNAFNYFYPVKLFLLATEHLAPSRVWSELSTSETLMEFGQIWLAN